MGIKRLVRVNELLKREIATALYRVMTEQSFDFASVTVTGVRTSSDLRSARVGISIRDHDSERGTMLSQIRKHARDIQSIVHHNVILKYTPKLHFELDTSIEVGDHVLQILSEMQGPAADDLPSEEDGEAQPEDGGEERT